MADPSRSDGGFFVFGDLSVKVEGEFRLRFSLFEMCKYVKILGAPRTTKLTGTLGMRSFTSSP